MWPLAQIVLDVEISSAEMALGTCSFVDVTSGQRGRRLLCTLVCAALGQEDLGLPWSRVSMAVASTLKPTWVQASPTVALPLAWDLKSCSGLWSSGLGSPASWAGLRTQGLVLGLWGPESGLGPMCADAIMYVVLA